MIYLLLFILGLALLLWGSRGVILNALLISRHTGIPPLIIGATIVAIGTSLPEMVVSFFGALDKAPDIALGNIIGSNIANIGLILGISLLIKSIYIGKSKTQMNMIIALLLSLFLFFSLLFTGLTFIHGIVFLILGVVLIIWQIIHGKTVGLDEELPIKSSKKPLLTVGIFTISLISLFVGGKLLVDSGVQIAGLLGIPKSIIGLTAIAIGTSVPELAVSIVGLTRSVSRNEEKLVIGNILGSNIYNILFGAGILGIFGIKNFNSPVSLYAFLLFTLFFCFIIYIFKGKQISKYLGFLFLSMYAIYLFLLFI